MPQILVISNNLWNDVKPAAAAAEKKHKHKAY